MARTRVNERTRLPVEVTFLATNNRPSPPANARWRFYCATTGTDLTGWADISVPSNGVFRLELPASMTRIIDPANRTEIKVLAVEAEPGTETQVSDEHEFEVKNLRKTD